LEVIWLGNLGVPTRTIKLRQVVFGNLVGVQQRRGDDDHLGTKTRLFDSHTRLPNRKELGKRIIRFSIHRTRFRGLGPLDDVIVLSKTLSTSKIGSALAQAGYGFDAALLEHHQVRPRTHQAIREQDIAGGK
jgi:hypothetical protein